MNTIGIICEYNPFHNGHIYHLKKIKELFPDSLIILVLNGYFLERGEISITSKKDKVKIALLEGIDIVIELPLVYGTQSADIFADKSVYILEQLQCEYLVFGSESNDLDTLSKIANYSISEKDVYDKEVKKYLDQGLNYPTSLAKALNINFEFKPNDLLGISYLKSIINNKYHIKPITIKRTNDYLDTLSNEDIISATNIRNKIKNNIDISKYVPNSTLPYLKTIKEDELFNLLKYKIITEKDLSIYLDVDEGIDNRLKKVIYECNTFEELVTKLKSKRYTYNRIKRMLIHILIGLTKNDNHNLNMDYIRTLGFNSTGKEYLNKIKKDINIPLTINKDSLIYKYELTGAAIYDIIIKDNNLDYEISGKPIIM